MLFFMLFSVVPAFSVYGFPALPRASGCGFWPCGLSQLRSIVMLTKSPDQTSSAAVGTSHAVDTSHAVGTLSDPDNAVTSWLLRGAALGALSAVAGAAALTYAYAVEPMRMELEKRTVCVANAQGRLPAHGLRILHLSDSHFKGGQTREREKIARIRKLTAGLEYDLLIHTGDFIHKDAGLEYALELLAAVPRPRLGAYGVLGNHDYAHYAMQAALPRMWKSFVRNEIVRGWPVWTRPLRLPWFISYVRNTPLDGRRTGHNDSAALVRTLEAAGVTILHNRGVHLFEPENELDLYLAGVEDVCEASPHLESALTRAAAAAAHSPVVLLSHNPDILVDPRMGEVDVMLAGHTHGGQLVLPLWGPAHTQSQYLARHEVAGYFRRGRTHVYISRGLGEGIPLRWRARPQIALLTLQPGPSLEAERPAAPVPMTAGRESG
jgi:predicted MPP superfamily phosphohydrolase